MSNTILIVDDEAFMRRLIEASLKKGGLTTASVGSGEQALAWAAHHQPALIVMDLMMPGLDGLATLRRIKDAGQLRKIPVIMLTAKGHKLTQVEAQMSGAAVFLTKPFSPSRLLEETRRLLGEVPA